MKGTNISGFVLDASVVIAWTLREDDPRANLAWDRARIDDASVPTLWWFELRNALIVNERRGRIKELQTARFLREISRLPITMDRAPDETGVLILARRHRLTVYDAAYLELALRKALPLASLDAQLAAAARSETVLLIGD
jgi:predicted nucleic acid-binding protein